jgi:hypothetical protein
VAKPFPSFYEVISNDEEATLKTIVQITTGITSIVDPVQASLEHFEKRYRKLWDQDKDAYMRRYEKAQKPLSSYEADVTEYNNKQVGTPVTYQVPAKHTPANSLLAMLRTWCVVYSHPSMCLTRADS